MTAIFSAAELLALAPAELRELVDQCPGDYVSTRAAVLGLDVDTPEHLAALQRAYPDAFNGLEPVTPAVPAGQSGVRSDLTPPGPAPADPYKEVPGPVGAGTDALNGSPDPVAVEQMLAAYRGQPMPFLAGTFAMYAAPDGSVVMVTESPDRGVERHTIPAKIVRLGIGMMSGRGGMLGKLLGRG